MSKTLLKMGKQNKIYMNVACAFTSQESYREGSVQSLLGNIDAPWKVRQDLDPMGNID